MVACASSGKTGVEHGLPDALGALQPRGYGAGATLDLNGATTAQTLAGLSGSGTVRGDVTLADGAEAVAGAVPVTITGTLTFAGAGTVVLPETIESTPAVFPLFSARDYVGVENLSRWTFANMATGKRAVLRVRDGVAEACICASGMTILFR